MNKYRTIFISDIHIGSKASQVDKLLKFLKENSCDNLILIGDIVDIWRLSREWYWPEINNKIIKKLIKMAEKGTNIIYIPGNHDELFRNFSGIKFGEIKFENEIIYDLANGNQALIIHGDRFDGILKYAQWISKLGDTLYTTLLTWNKWLNIIRKKIGLKYWSLSKHLKHKVKKAVQFMNNYEHAIVDVVKRKKLDIIICGHIHEPVIKKVEDILYCNTGDWVENMSAIVETHTGKLKIVHYKP